MHYMCHRAMKKNVTYAKNYGKHGKAQYCTSRNWMSSIKQSSTIVRGLII